MKLVQHVMHTDKDHAIICVKSLTDPKLSNRAKCIHIYAMAKPYWWELRVGDLTKYFGERKAVLRALKELEDAHYLYRTKGKEQNRTARGTFESVVSHWFAKPYDDLTPDMLEIPNVKDPNTVYDDSEEASLFATCPIEPPQSQNGTPDAKPPRSQIGIPVNKSSQSRSKLSPQSQKGTTYIRFTLSTTLPRTTTMLTRYTTLPINNTLDNNTTPNSIYNNIKKCYASLKANAFNSANILSSQKVFCEKQAEDVEDINLNFETPDLSDVEIKLIEDKAVEIASTLQPSRQKINKAQSLVSGQKKVTPKPPGKKGEVEPEVQEAAKALFGRLLELSSENYIFTSKIKGIWFVTLRNLAKKKTYTQDQIDTAICNYSDAGYPMDAPALFLTKVNYAVRGTLKAYDKTAARQKYRQEAPVTLEESAEAQGKKLKSRPQALGELMQGNAYSHSRGKPKPNFEADPFT